MSIWGTTQPENGQNGDAIPSALEDTVAPSKSYYQKNLVIVKHQNEFCNYAQFRYGFFVSYTVILS